jgi:hypothetical protein
MKTKWNLEKVEEEFEIIENKEFRKIIEEMAELVYLNVCQLQKNSSLDLLDNETKSLEKAA